MTAAELAGEIARAAVAVADGRLYWSDWPSPMAMWMDADHQRRSYVIGYARGFLDARQNAP